VNKQSNPKRTVVHRVRPLYDNGLTSVIAKVSLRTANTALVFDRYPDIWSGDYSKTPWKPESPKDSPSVRQMFLSEICVQSSANRPVLQSLLDTLHKRRNALVRILGGSIIDVQTVWRFVSGLGMSHALENGFVWDRNLGIPYLPGSSVKGAVRAWAELWHKDDPKVWEAARCLFGDEKDLGAGQIIVFDAYPVQVPFLEVDVMNVHYKDFYDNKKSGGKRVPPADYLSPNPIFFLTVASGTKFSFALAPRIDDSNAKKRLKLATDLLRQALATLAVGAKTAVGYGLFR
jgi:CRISPR-associated protein Cmr6